MLLSVCCLVLLTAGCSGDDGDEKAKDEESPDAQVSVAPKKEEARLATTQDCDAEVSTTGAFEWEWSGPATVRTGGGGEDAPGPDAVYALKHEQHQAALYSSGVEFEGSVTLSVGKAFYASDPADAASLDIDPGGTHADVDVQLTSTADDVIQLEAEFTCGKNRKKQD